MNRIVTGSALCALSLGVGALAFAGSGTGSPDRGRADPLVELGRRLFFDPAVSKSGNNSCASCHDPEHGYSSGRTREDDDFSMTRRRSQTLVDAALAHSFHWDGEFERIEDLVNARLGAPNIRRAAGATGAMAAGPQGHVAPSLPVGGGGAGAGGASGAPPAPPPPGYAGGSAAAGGDSAEPPPPPPGAPPPGGESHPYGDTGGTGDAPPAAPAGAPPTEGTPPTDGDGYGDSPPPGGPYSGDNTTDESGKEVAGSGNVGDPGTCGGRYLFKKPSGAINDGRRAPTDPDPDPDPAAPPTTDGAGAPSTAPAPTTPTPVSAAPSSPSGSTTPSDGAAPPAAPGAPSWLGPTEAGDGPGRLAGDDPARGQMLVAERVERDGRYASAFVRAFGTPHVTTMRLAKAISAFVESIRSNVSAYDRFAGGDDSALSASAVRGLALFKGKAGCAQCHTMDGARKIEDGRATFSDGRFHDTGVSLRTSITRPVTGADGLLSRAPFDIGRAMMTRNPKESGAFKTPTLRDVASRAPYMHDGSLATLDEVIAHYAKGGFADPNLDPAIRGFDLVGTDAADLKAFLEGLSSESRPGAAPRWSERVALQTVRLLDAQGRPLVGIPVDIVAAGDVLPGAVTGGDRTQSAVTDANGDLSFRPTRRTHARLDLPEGLRISQGALVPDTCASLSVRLPVEGTATLVVSSSLDVEPPARIVAVRAPSSLSLAMFEVLRRLTPERADAICRRETTFRTEGSVVVAGRKVTRYRAWVPTGASERTMVELPIAGDRKAFEVTLVAGAETRVDAGR